MNNERLQKVLSQAGLGSRREMERWILQGIVYVNGKPASIGQSVSEHDTLTVRGQAVVNPLKGQLKTRVLLYHKPVGEISSRSDPKHSKTVFDNLPYIRQGRWVQVGRLDINTSGLLIFTNNGELANCLMHPKFEQEREYAVRVHGQVSAAVIALLQKGVELEDGVAKFEKIEFRGGEGANSWYHVVLNEGRNREVRRLWESQGLEVSRLIRIRYGKITMPRYLARGDFTELTPVQVSELMSKLPIEQALVIEKMDERKAGRRSKAEPRAEKTSERKYERKSKPESRAEKTDERKYERKFKSRSQAKPYTKSEDKPSRRNRKTES